MFSDKRLPIAVLAGVLLGAALGWLLIPEPAPDTPISPQEPQLEAMPVREAPRQADQTSREAATPTVRKPAPLGDGVIRGVARYADGKPCPGLQLVAEPPRSDGLLWWEHSNVTPGELRADHATTAQWLRERALRATTGADGAFEFAGVGEGDHQLFSNDKARPLAKRPQPCKAGDELELVVERVFHVPVEVTFPGGELPERLGINVTPERGQARYASWTKDGATVEVTPGKQKVSTQAAHGMAYAETEIDVPTEGIEGPIKLELKRKDGLVVHVDFPRPFYVGATLVVMRSDLVPPTLAELSRKLDFQNIFITPWVGREIAPGRYTAMVLLSEVEVLAREEIDYTGGYREVTLKVPPIDRADHIVLRVYDTKDRPLDEVDIYFFPEGSSHRQTTNVSRRGKGEYWLKPGPVHDYYFGNPYKLPTYWVIRASNYAFGVQMTTVPIDSREEVEIRFRPKGKFTVVLDGLPEGSGDYRLSIRPRGGSEEDFTGRGRFLETAPQTPARARNEYEIPPGVVVVSLRAVGPMPTTQSAGVRLVEQEYNFSGEPMQVNITVPALSDLHVSVPEAETSGWLRLEGPSINSPQQLPGKERRMVFRNLPAGLYHLRSDEGEMPVRLPAAGEVVFQSAAFNAAMVERVDKANLMGKFGLLPGDILLEVNGAPFTGKRWAIYHQFKNAAQAGAVTIRGRRGDQPFTINAPADEWKKMDGFHVEAIRLDE